MSPTQDYSHLLGKLQSHGGNLCSTEDLMWTNAGESLLNLCVLYPVSTSAPKLGKSLLQGTTNNVAFLIVVSFLSQYLHVQELGNRGETEEAGQLCFRGFPFQLSGSHLVSHCRDRAEKEGRATRMVTRLHSSSALGFRNRAPAFVDVSAVTSPHDEPRASAQL